MRTPNRFFKKYLIILVIVVGLIVLNIYIIPGKIQGTFYNFGGKLLGIFYDAAYDISQSNLGTFWNSFWAGQIIKENRELKFENINLLDNLAQLEQLELENKILREQLKINIPDDTKLLPVKIYSINRTGLASTIVINKGSKDSLKKSLAVISGGNVLVGVINEVFENSAIILRLDDPRSRINVRVSSDDVIGTAQGGVGVNQVVLDFITNKDLIKQGDLIVTGGLDALPAGLLVAKVNKVELKGGSLFKSVRADLLSDYFSSPTLFVLVNK